MMKEWLTEKVSVERVEQDFTGADDGRVPNVPFGFQNAAWEELKGEMRPGDELWLFSSDNESWQRLAGRAGVCAVRDGDVVGSLVTRIS
jgi:hypothetical protein